MKKIVMAHIARFSLYCLLPAAQKRRENQNVNEN